MLGLSPTILVGFGVYAVILSLRDPNATKNVEMFVTARRQIGTFILAWSFFATSLGSWEFFLTAQYAGGLIPTGFLGVTAQATACAVPILTVAAMGRFVLKNYPNVQSYSDFIRLRFGPGCWVLATFVSLFNMSVCLLAEYTNMSTFYYNFVDVGTYPNGERLMGRADVYYLVILAVVIVIYTILGGLKVSMITDMAQGATCVILTIVLWIWIGARYRKPLLQSQFDKAPLNGNNKAGQQGFPAQIFSIWGSQMFSEALWQRVWSATNPKSLALGSFIGASLSFTMAWVYGFGGVLAYWSGQPPLDKAANLTLFTLFRDNLSSGITAIVTIMVISANESASDSYTNGINATFTTFAEFLTYGIRDPSLFKRKKNIQEIIAEQTPLEDLSPEQRQALEDDPKRNGIIPRPKKYVLKKGTWYQKVYNKYWYRAFVVIINVILIPIACQQISTQLIFNIADLMGSFFAVALLSGIFVNPKYYDGRHVAGCSITGIVITHIYCALRYRSKINKGVLKGPYSHTKALGYTWIYTINGYDFMIFFLPIATSLVLVPLATTIEYIKKEYSKEAKEARKKSGEKLSFFRDVFIWSPEK